MEGMTFEQRVRRRWWTSIIWFVVGAVIVGMLTWVMMAFVVFVLITFEDTQRRLIMTVVQFLVYGSYLFAWSSRGAQMASTVDVVLRDAGPIERDLIVARLAQEGVPVAVIASDGVYRPYPTKPGGGK